eukprot:356851-Chlamydomonas_euryale.AAC.3
MERVPEGAPTGLSDGPTRCLPPAHLQRQAQRRQLPQRIGAFRMRSPGADAMRAPPGAACAVRHRRAH